MKKLLFIAFGLLCIFTIQANDPMVLESGTLDALADASKTVFFVVDYTNTTAHNDENKYTLDEYLKHRGDDFVHDWRKDKEFAYTYLPVTFNKKNKKGAQALLTAGDYDILGTIYLSDIDFGNAGAAYIPFGGAKSGGCIINGILVFTDTEGNELAKLPFVNVKGMANIREPVRLGLSYFELMNKLGDVIKKERKKKK